MHPLTELKRLLAARANRRTGTILSVAHGRAQVRTAAGVQDVALGAVTAAAGDRVAVQQGEIIGRLSSDPPPEYRV